MLGTILRVLAGVVAGVVVWGVVATLLNLALRYGWPAYRLAEPAMTFDDPMKAARLAESFVASIAAAVVAARIAPSRATPWMLAAVLLAVFIPVHIGLWTKFPIWYHATFLSSLLVISVAAGSLARGRKDG